MKNRLSKIKSKLVTPNTQEAKRLAHELRAPGETGRALPGPVQAQLMAQRQSPRKVGLPDIPAATGRSEISTYFTRVGGSQLLYQAEGWVRLRLLLSTAGPVSVGSRDDVAPVLSGKGITLPTDVEVTFSLLKGNRVFIAAASVNRVRVIIEPVPWGEQIATMLGNTVSLLRGA
jgi:hypothetical protein